MATRIVIALFGLFLSVFCGAAFSSDLKIVTALERGTYIQIGRDMEKLVARPLNMGLEVLPSRGSTENVKRLRYEPGVKLALVQSDVYQAFQDEAAAGNKEAERLIKPLKVIMPLYDTEMYFVVRADSPINYIHEIKDKKINIGVIGSGTAMSVVTLYRLMFQDAISEANVSTLSNEEALVKLVNGQGLDVIVVSAGQPAKIFTDMQQGAQQYIKLLKLDKSSPAMASALDVYPTAAIRASSYPNWLTEDVSTFAVKALLVTYDYQLPATQEMLARFGRALCEKHSALREEGHPKWQEVGFDLPSLGKNWTYYTPTERVIRECASARSTSFKPKSANACSQQEKVLGLCAGS